MTYPERGDGDVLQQATTVPLTFQRFPANPCDSAQHASNTRDPFYRSRPAADRTRHLAWVYGELEQTVCEARNMMRLAFEKAMDAKQSFKNDKERDDANMAMFTLTKAYEAVEKLFKEYYDAFGRPAFDKRRT